MVQTVFVMNLSYSLIPKIFAKLEQDYHSAVNKCCQDQGGTVLINENIWHMTFSETKQTA